MSKARFIALIFLLLVMALLNATLSALLTSTARSTVSSNLLPSNAASRSSVTILNDTPASSSVRSITYYVSKSGNNRDGLSWTTAWNELARIDWGQIQPGDVILLDGGAFGMIYTTSLTVGRSGTSDRPITIRLSDEAGRNGGVVVDGGLTYWPCQSSESSPYVDPHPASTRRFGIDLNGQSWITIDGTRWNGIEIRNHNQAGISFATASNIILSNLHIHHNTYATIAAGPGIAISGSNIVLERLEINNNGEDAIQGGNVNNLVLQDSYIHDHYCNHPDGIQLYFGANSNINIRRNTFTKLLQAIFLGEVNTTPTSAVNDVNIQYNIIYSTTYGIKSNNDNNTGWKVYNNTIVDTEEQGIHLYVVASGSEVRNNILYNSAYAVRNGIQSNNLFYQAPGAPSGNGSITADPQFVDPGARNYRLQATSPAIDQGVDVGLTRDYLGTIVPTGLGVDIGAFEYTTNPPTPTPSPTMTPIPIQHFLPLIQ
jgi:hypothetical protein